MGPTGNRNRSQDKLNNKPSSPQQQGVARDQCAVSDRGLGADHLQGDNCGRSDRRTHRRHHARAAGHGLCNPVRRKATEWALLVVCAIGGLRTAGRVAPALRRTRGDRLDAHPGRSNGCARQRERPELWSTGHRRNLCRWPDPADHRRGARWIHRAVPRQARAQRIHSRCLCGDCALAGQVALWCQGEKHKLCLRVHLSHRKAAAAHQSFRIRDRSRRHHHAAAAAQVQDHPAVQALVAIHPRCPCRCRAHNLVHLSAHASCWIQAERPRLHPDGIPAARSAAALDLLEPAGVHAAESLLHCNHWLHRVHFVCGLLFRKVRLPHRLFAGVHRRGHLECVLGSLPRRARCRRVQPVLGERQCRRQDTAGWAHLRHYCADCMLCAHALALLSAQLDAGGNHHCFCLDADQAR
eukprot:comp21787_c0_seq2/m.48874 comp21787_c0_seq2/g.48874  ORF comp21787_c0_seq2/g.48874 comp21787_c0_seq2/m.48874 type:complete len:410 (+) comp21787_c0_seq2:501-1730(+)